MRKSLHTSEILEARKNVQKALDLLTRDPSTYANTYIPADEIQLTMVLLQSAEADLHNALYTEAGGKRRIAQTPLDAVEEDYPSTEGYFVSDGDAVD